MKPAHIIALVIIGVTLAATLFAFSNSLAPSMSVSEAMKRPGELVQVRGTIIKGSANYVPGRGLSFEVREVRRLPNGKEEAGEQTMTIVYTQPKPENFDEANGVEAIGRYEGGVFKADNLLVKCPSKYVEEAPGKPSPKPYPESGTRAPYGK